MAGALESSSPLGVMLHRPQLPHTLAGFLSTSPHTWQLGRFREERGRSEALPRTKENVVDFPSVWGSLGRCDPLVPGNDLNL